MPRTSALAALLLATAAMCLPASAFSPSSAVSRPARSWSLGSALPSADAEAAIAELDDDRRANLFQATLRDLQVESVPLMGCDANRVETMNAALWTTMAELSESDVEVAMADIDTGGDNEIEFDEMVNWLERENLWDPQRAA